MSNIVVVGGQWGDEGKGKIVDLLTQHVAICARFSGGHNAGHTVKVGDVRHALHLIPCGILRPDVTCVIGNGVVVEPGKLLAEVDQLLAQGIGVEGRLLVSDRAHVILPHHPIVDRTREEELAGSKIGTTSRGIGPAYEDKCARVGLRMADLYDPDVETALAAQLRTRNDVIGKLWGAQPLPVAEIAKQFLGPGGCGIL